MKVFGLLAIASVAAIVSGHRSVLLGPYDCILSNGSSIDGVVNSSGNDKCMSISNTGTLEVPLQKAPSWILNIGGYNVAALPGTKVTLSEETNTTTYPVLTHNW